MDQNLNFTNESMQFTIRPLGNFSSGNSGKEQTYKCSQCSFTTTWKSSLHLHQKTHTDEKPWKCFHCGKEFRLKHHLKHHMATHSKLKDFKCTICDYRTGNRYNLQNHKINRHRLQLTNKRRKNPSKQSNYDNTLPSMVVGSSFDDNNQSLTSPATGYNLLSPTDSSDFYKINFQSISIPDSSINILNTESISDQAFTSMAKSSQNNIAMSSRGVDFSSSPDSVSSVKKVLSPILCVKEDIGDNKNKPNSFQSLYHVTEGQSSKNVVSVEVTTPSNQISNTVSRRLSKNQEYQPKLDNRQSLNINKQNHETFIEIQNPTLTSESSNMQLTLKETSKEQLEWCCRHCDIKFPDNIMYGLHMGCHCVSHPFQCNICGEVCKDKHDFMFHFTIGKHKTL